MEKTKEETRDIYEKLRALERRINTTKCGDCELDDLGDVNAPAPAADNVLTWDAPASEWQAKAGGAGGAGDSYAYVDDQWYSMEIVCNNNLGSLFYIGANYLWAYPMPIGQAQNFDHICACVYSAVAGSNFRLGIYKCNSATGYPSDLVCDSGALSAATTGCKTAAITAALSAELHYLAILGSHNIQFRATRRGYVGTFLGRASCSNVYHGTCWRVVQAYGALPDPFPGGAAIRVEQYCTAILIQAA